MSAIGSPPLTASIEAAAAPPSRSRQPRGPLVERPLLIILGLGAVLRAVTMIGYSPSALQWIDAIRYTRSDPVALFDDYFWPAGYPVFLAGLRLVSDDLTFTIAVQHALGLGTAALLYASVRRIGAPPAIAAVPALVAALGGDHLYLEHVVMADTLYGFLGVAGLYVALRGLDRSGGRALVTFGGAAALLMAAGLTRSAGFTLPLVLLLVLVATGARPVRARLLPAAVVAVTSIGLMAGYLAVASSGKYAGVSDMTGWHLYSRIAPTVDCSRFTPPAGTRMLCDPRPVADRPGSFYYEWDPASPARMRWDIPEGNDELRRFARAAILADPVMYAKVVAKDLVRYVEPTAGRDRAASGVGADTMVFGFRDATTEALVDRYLSTRYDGVGPVRAGGIELLDTYQRVSRLNSLERLLMILLAVGGLLAARGPLLRGILLFGASALGLLALPAATLSWDYRYGTPPMLLLACAAALGGWALWLRLGPGSARRLR